MKILIVGPYPEDVSCIKGGTESSVFGLAHELQKRNDVVVADYPRVNGYDAIECSMDLTVYRFRTYGKHYEDAVSRIKDIEQLINKFHPQAVHIHGTNVFCYKLYQWCKQNNIHVIFTVHGLAAVEKRNAMNSKFSLKALYQYVRQSWYEHKILNCAERCIVDTGYVADAIRKYKLQHYPQMYIIPQGINNSYFHIEKKTNPSGKKLILSVGTISKRKGRLQLLDAFDMVCNKLNNVELVIAGANKDFPMYIKVLQRIEKSPNKNRISIYPNIAQEDLLNLYAMADVFALHTQEESQGIVFAEAMAVGLPVVATKVGGVPYVINDARSEKERKAIGKTVTGFLGNFDDVEDMANSIEKVLTDDVLYEELSSNAKREAHYYDWKVIADQIIDLYHV